LDFIDHPHECHNSLKVTDETTLRQIGEEAGYLRTEVERKLNRCLKTHGANGNVVSGNFYTAKQFGTIRGEDFEYTGFASAVHTDKIQSVLSQNNDVVLLTTVGLSHLGELVNVNGYHLSAAVAAALNSYKLIYMSNEGAVMKNKDGLIQELTLSSAQAITDYHSVQVHNTGFATFELARQSLDPGAVELLLHLGWSAWAMQHGVNRAHIVNPSDGAILEELFTSKNGANTCILQDEVEASEDELDQDDWDNFFDSADKQGQTYLTFG
jgi:acetylglutamate kinase